MNLPANAFKRALAEGRRQLGAFLALGDAHAAELMASAGFDWLLIDAEHGPNELPSILAQLQALAGYPVQAVLRPADHDPARIKQYLDLGVQSLLVPMVDTAAQAQALVAWQHEAAQVAAAPPAIPPLMTMIGFSRAMRRPTSMNWRPLRSPST
jgi:4-hydroxy-2-oxoheptanedioate aldolase